jgi:hypothetical protein
LAFVASRLELDREMGFEEDAGRSTFFVAAEESLLEGMFSPSSFSGARLGFTNLVDDAFDDGGSGFDIRMLGAVLRFLRALGRSPVTGW